MIEYIQTLKKTLDKLDEQKIVEIAIKIKQANHVYIFGNGGSSATSTHFVVDLVKACNIRAFCLNDNIPSITAFANDVVYASIFAEQVKRLVSKYDLVIGISGSGNSENVIQGVLAAKELKAYTVGLTGYDGGELGTIVDFHLNVPVNDMQIAEDIHLILTHIICKQIKT